MYIQYTKMKIVFATARKVQQFATIIANLKNFTDNVCIYFRENGLYIQCLDDSHCCLFECDLKSTWFKTYEFSPDTDQNCIGINISMLNKVLNTWNETQTLTLELEDGSDKIAINFEKSDNNNVHFDKFFELSLVSLESDLMDVKNFDTLVDLTVESKIFCSLISNLMMFNEVLTLTFNEENVECTSSGTDGSMKALINVNDVTEYAIPESTILVQSYSLRYVQLMCQFNKLAPEMRMGFGESMPMVMKYILSEDNDKDSSYACIHLAPKIVED
jgi:proliferating cell nuclear antigen PCNA